MESREYFFLFIVFIFQIFIVCDYGSSANAESNKLQENGLIHSLENNEEYVMRSNSPDSQKSVTGNEAVILLHGFGKSKSDMSTLKKYFESTGYHVICPTLPTTFQSVKNCIEEFEQLFHEINGKYDRIHFVGHSMGGLIIRLFLSRNQVPELGRCVLISTPNKGTVLAAIPARFFTFSLQIFKSLEAFQPGGVKIPPPLNNPAPEIGLITGNRNNLFLGRFIKSENDGRVPVDSVPFEGMKEFIVQPYNHKKIHHRQEVAKLVHRFLQEGTFGITAQ